MEIDWSLIVQIGILICLVYISFFLTVHDEVNRRNLNKLYKYLEEIKENQ